MTIPDEWTSIPTMETSVVGVDQRRTIHDDEFLRLPDDWSNIEHIITEDDEPVENIFSEKQQRLLTEPLKSSWAGPGAGRSFVAFANVGLFYRSDEPALVPDAMLSLDVVLPDDIWLKTHRSYFLHTFGKPPDVVIEIVSNQKGGEDRHKLQEYAKVRVPYYIIFDPQNQLRQGVLRVYEWHGGIYDELPATWMPHVGLGVMLWHGVYEDREDTWLRWCNEQGKVIPTGKEQADHERQEKERERQEKEQALLHMERERQEKEHERQEKEQALLHMERERQEKEQAILQAERLAMKLRELGIDPNTLG